MPPEPGRRALEKDRELRYQVVPTNKDDVLKLIDCLTSAIHSLDAFSAFPEGSAGVVVYALLKILSHTSEDIGDLNYRFQGLEMVLKASFDEICEDLRGPS